MDTGAHLGFLKQHRSLALEDTICELYDEIVPGIVPILHVNGIKIRMRSPRSNM